MNAFEIIALLIVTNAGAFLIGYEIGWKRRSELALLQLDDLTEHAKANLRDLANFRRDTGI